MLFFFRSERFFVENGTSSRFTIHISLKFERNCFFCHNSQKKTPKKREREREREPKLERAQILREPSVRTNLWVVGIVSTTDRNDENTWMQRRAARNGVRGFALRQISAIAL